MSCRAAANKGRERFDDLRLRYAIGRALSAVAGTRRPSVVGISKNRADSADRLIRLSEIVKTRRRPLPEKR